MTNAVIDRVVAAIDDGVLSRIQLERSCDRVALLRRSASSATPLSPTAFDPTAAQQVAERAIVVDGQLPAGPFAVLECRPPGSMACFNVSWGIAAALGERGWQTTSMTVSDPIGPTCDAVLLAAGDMPLLVVVRDACVHTWQTEVVDALVDARRSSVVVVELGWPSDRPRGAAAFVVTHGAARSSAQAVIDSLVSKEP
jgi:hypothetical protein